MGIGMNPSRSSRGARSCKRKHSDCDEQWDARPLVPGEEGPLSEAPIENEYENLDDDSDDLGDDDKVKAAKWKEYKDILQAEEEATEASYGDIKITPFNLEEERKEGKFDASGNYIFEKEQEDEESDDAWADSVDWDAVEKKVRKREEEKELKMQVEKEEEADPPAAPLDRISSYKQMLRLMRVDETVQKTIRRLGNDVPKRNFKKSSSKINKTSTAAMDQAESSQTDIAEARRKLDLMIELAHQRLEDGETDVYQMSYEDLEEAIN